MAFAVGLPFQITNSSEVADVARAPCKCKHIVRERRQLIHEWLDILYGV